jgi:predicted RNA methylase
MNIKVLYEFLLSDKADSFFAYIKGKNINEINQIHRLKTKFADYPVSELLTLIRLRKNASKRIKDADKMLFTTKGVEQSSSTNVAVYHAEKFALCSKIADLCCGNGVDLINLAKGKNLVYALDYSNTALSCSKFNAKLLGLNNIIFIQDKAEGFSEQVDGIFIDPDRRPDDRRVIQGIDISPNFDQIKKIISTYKNVVVKLSPVFKYEDESIAEDYTWEFISEDGVLKEILLCTGRFATKDINKKAVLLPDMYFQQTNEEVTVTGIKKYIYDLDPSIIRSGLVQDLAQSIGGELINKHLAILTSDKKLANCFIKAYEVKDIFHYNKKLLQKYIKENEIGKLVVKVKGFPERPNQVIQKLKLKGKNESLIYLIRMDKEFLTLIIERL